MFERTYQFHGRNFWMEVQRIEKESVERAERAERAEVDGAAT